MWVLIVLLILLFCFCRKESFTPEIWGGCPDHCNCVVYTQGGKFVGCQRARMTAPCKPHHKDRVCRDASVKLPKGISQFKVSCCGASCGRPGRNIGHSLYCVKNNGKWVGHLHSCRYAGEDLRCHK